MRMSARTLLVLVALGLLTSCARWVSACAPKARLIEGEIRQQLRATPENGSGESIDHSTYAELLAEHVDERAGRVDYSGLQSDRESLTSYLDRLAAIDLAAISDDAQMALLINAYNACTLELILRHYPDLDSIKDIDDPWGQPLCTVGGHDLTLDEIEHRILRPLYRDPRIHFAVNCASIGCPPLAETPYTSRDLEAQLDRAAERTLQSARYVRVDDGKLHLNPIMNWYRSDFLSERFEDHANSIPAYVARYASSSVVTSIEQRDGSTSVTWMDYDWSLNDMP